MALKIRALEFNDFTEWLPVWDANNEGHKNENVTAQTWQRLCDKDSPVCGLAAFEGDHIVGILHYILHPTTGHISHACYMQDLFTLPKHRKKGIAKKMLQALLQEHKKQKWARIYWVAKEDNAAAQKLYDGFGKKLDFSFHVLL
jgi:ribosomal protein S18 acetylase RimI-like enzyme